MAIDVGPTHSIDEGCVTVETTHEWYESSLKGSAVPGADLKAVIEDVRCTEYATSVESPVVTKKYSYSLRDVEQLPSLEHMNIQTELDIVPRPL